MDENGCEEILEMGSQSEVEELEEERREKLLCLWLNIRNYIYEYVNVPHAVTRKGIHTLQISLQQKK